MAIRKDVDYRLNVDRGRDTGVDALKRAQQAADKFDASLESATRQAKNLDRAVDDAAGSSINFGRAGGGVERILGGLGASEASGLIGLVGDIGDVTEAMGDKGLRGVVSSLISPAGALTAGLAAVTVGIGILSQRLTEAADDANAASDAFIRQRELSREIQREGLTTAQIEERLADARRREAEALQNISGQTEVLNATFEESQRQLGDFGARIGTFALNLGGGFNTLNEDVKKSEEALAQARTEIAFYTRALESQAVAINDAAEATESQMRGTLIYVSRAFETIRDTATGAMDAITTAAENAAEAADKAKKEFTDLQTAAQRAVDRLAEQQQALGTALRETIEGLNQNLIDVQTEANNDIIDAQADFNAERLNEELEFQKEAARAEQDFRRELARVRRDAKRDERAAIEDNNIIAALEARENRRAEVSDIKERYRIERDRRAQDFADRRKAEEAALAATIADIIKARDAEIAAIQAEIVAERAAFDAKMREINRLKQGEIDRVRAVALANQQRYSAEDALITAIVNKVQTFTALVNSLTGAITPATPPQGALPLPNIGGEIPFSPFLPFNAHVANSASGGGTRSGSSAGNIINFAPGSIVVGDIASRQDVIDGVRAGISQVLRGFGDVASGRVPA